MAADDLGSTKSSVSKDDFQLLKVIGRGAFGKVYMVQHNATEQIYAMKSIKKELIIRTDQIEGTKGKLFLTSNRANMVTQFS